MSTEDVPPDIEAMWREALTNSHRHPAAFLPGGPRCAVCFIAMGGASGLITRHVFRRRPSRKNPSICNYCDDVLPIGGAEVNISVLFADVRGSTGIAENMGPGAYASLLNRFYKAVSGVLVPMRAIVDKMIGDEVMAFFPPMSHSRYREEAVEAAVGIMNAVGYGEGSEPWLPVGIGVHTGPAYVGRVGGRQISDLTALGDTVNIAARLQAEAKAGEVVISEELYQYVAERYPDLEQRTLTLRGRAESLQVRVLRMTSRKDEDSPSHLTLG